MSHRYLLQPKGNGSKSKSDDLGSLRVKLTYIEDTVLPSACYTALCNLLLKSPDVKVKKIVSWNETFVIRNVFDKAWFFLLSVFLTFHSPSQLQQGTSWVTSTESATRLFCPWFDCCSTTIDLCLLSLLWWRWSSRTLSEFSHTSCRCAQVMIALKSLFYKSKMCVYEQGGQHYISWELTGNTLHWWHDENCGEELPGGYPEACSGWGMNKVTQHTQI